MTPPALADSAAPALEIDADVLVVGVVKAADGPRIEGSLGDELATLGTGLAALGLTLYRLGGEIVNRVGRPSR